MKSDYYVKLSALLLLISANLSSIYGFNLKKNYLENKKNFLFNKNINDDSNENISLQTTKSLRTSFIRNNSIKSNQTINITNENKNQTINKNFLNKPNQINKTENDLLKENATILNNYTLKIISEKFNNTKSIEYQLNQTLIPNNKLINFNKNNKQINTQSEIVFESSENNKNTFEDTSIVDNLKKFILSISIYSQLFLIFTTISLLKLYEEYFKIKVIYCENKYSHFKVLTDENKEAILENSQSYIFTNGKPQIIEEAHDNIFDFPKHKKFVKIERIVEIYRADDKSWKVLGKKALRNNSNLHDYEQNKIPDFIEEMIEEEKDNYNKLSMHINTLDKIYTFPKIFSKMFVGKVSYIS